MDRETLQKPTTTTTTEQKNDSSSNDAKDVSCRRTVEVKNKATDKNWRTYQACCVQDFHDFAPDEVPRSPYGGRRDGNMEPPTGFFHVTQIRDNRQWTLVDPQGCIFICAGVNSVAPELSSEPCRTSFANKFISRSDWAHKTHNVLFHNIQFNTLGCWSDASIFQTAGIRIPYCPRWNFIMTYCRIRPRGRVKLSDHPLPCFDPEFVDFCDEYAKGLIEDSNDPWLLGHFSDNELPLKEKDILCRYLALPQSDPDHEAALQWLRDRGKTATDITAQDNTDFCHVVIGRYFQIVGTAIKKYDPNHLFLGSRFHGSVLSQDCPFTACAPWLDVISVNYYHRFTPEQVRMNHWSQYCWLQNGMPRGKKMRRIVTILVA